MESGHRVGAAAGKDPLPGNRSGRPLVFVHGLLVDGLLWRKVTPLLEGEFRCIVPDGRWARIESPIRHRPIARPVAWRT